jgi:tyrosyl-tRNA synthetase
MKPTVDKKKIDEIFDRGIVADIIPSREVLMKFLLSGKRLKIYIGADPTASSLHLGHAGNYLFLEDLRKLGHEVIMLIGDFTARIGDPSDRSTARKPLSGAEVRENMKGWVDQLRPILGFDDKKNPVGVVYNSTWLEKLRFTEILGLASHFTVQQMIERDMFRKRWDENSPIHLDEFLYPLMQGYDSVALGVNVELCGTDQLFNALAGRTLLKQLEGEDKFVITLKLLQNPKTGEMMSKSKGTGIFLSAPANEMFGAVMAQPDEMTETLFIHCTRLPLLEKDKVMKLAPKTAKMRLAFEIVKLFHGEKAAHGAQENFEKIFSKKELPDDIPELKVKEKNISSLDLAFSTGVLKSKSDARRLIEQGGFEYDSAAIKDPKEVLIIKPGAVLRVGKKYFFRIKK